VHVVRFGIAIDLSVRLNYGRRPGVLGIPAPRPVPAASPAATSDWKLRLNRLPLRRDGFDTRPDRRFIRPVVWIETLNTFDQPVAILWRSGTAANLLQ
jgi:hypothetical protein